RRGTGSKSPNQRILYAERGESGAPEGTPGAASVLVATFAMDMAVLDFLGGGIAHFGDFHCEMQGFTGQRVVAVDSDFIVAHVGNGKQAYAHAGLGLELHARLQVINTFKRGAR